MPAPAEKPEVLAAQRRSTARCDQRRLDHQRAGAAHRVQELRAGGSKVRPSRPHQHTGGHVFLQRRLAGRAAIPAAVQTLTGEIDGQSDRRTVGVRMHTYTRPIQHDVGPGAGRIAQRIDDRILQLQGAEVAVCDRRMLAAEIAGQRRTRSQMLAPLALAGRGVEAVRACGLEPRDLEKYPIGES
jgi:hypothetical protein